MSNISFPLATTSLFVNTLNTNKIINLPAASTIKAGQLFYIKDICGNAATSSIYISTLGLDRLEGTYTSSTSSFFGLITTNYGSVLMAPDGVTNWYFLQHYSQNVMAKYAIIYPTDLTGLRYFFDATISTLSTSLWPYRIGLNSLTLNSSPTVNRSGTVSYVTFDGSSQYGSSLDLTGLQNFTITMWIRTTSTVDNGTYYLKPYLMGTDTAGDASRDFGLTLGGGYTGIFSGLGSIDRYNQPEVGTTAPNYVADGNWHEVTVTSSYTNGTILYTDGVPIGSALAASQTINTLFFVGACNRTYSSTGSFAAFDTSVILVYTRELSYTELKANNNKYRGRFGRTAWTYAPFTPLNLNNVIAFFDVNAGISQSGTALTSWTNQVGAYSSLNLTSVNGSVTLGTYSANTSLKTILLSSGYIQNNGSTVAMRAFICVLNATSIGGLDMLFSLWTVRSDFSFRRVKFSTNSDANDVNNGSDGQVYWNGSSAWNGSAYTIDNSPIGSWNILFVRFASAQTTGIGISDPFYSRYYNGYIGDFIFFGTSYTSTEQQKTEGYLAWKWGLQGNLPSNHPYKSATP